MQTHFARLLTACRKQCAQHCDRRLKLDELITKLLGVSEFLLQGRNPVLEPVDTLGHHGNGVHATAHLCLERVEGSNLVVVPLDTLGYPWSGLDAPLLVTLQTTRTLPAPVTIATIMSYRHPLRWRVIFWFREALEHAIVKKAAFPRELLMVVVEYSRVGT